MSTADPFSRVINRMWEMLEDRAGFTDLVKTGNRIKLTGTSNKNVLKDRLQEGDVPELTIVIRNIESIDLFETSDTGACLVNFDLRLATGDVNYQLRMGPVVWEIMQAFAKNSDGDIGLPFVTTCRLISGDKLLDADDIPGWKTIFRVQVQVTFNRDDENNLTLEDS